MNTNSTSHTGIDKHLLRPVACADLIRIGGIFDGGYVLPAFTVAGTSSMLSLGVSDDISFELAFLKRNPTVRVLGYDHTVGRIFWLRKVARHLLRVAYYFFTNRLKFIKYREKLGVALRILSFFGGRHQLVKKRIADTEGPDTETISGALAHLPAGPHGTFLKMDIEGSEYEVMDELLRHHQRFNVIAAEFHLLDTRTAAFNRAINQLSAHFYCTHIHGNNYGRYAAELDFPVTVEITWVHKALFAVAPPLSSASLPLPHLDSPCKPGVADHVLRFG